MTTFIKWLNNRAVLGVLLAFALIYDLVLLGRAYDLDKSEWASWVQAVGSITALGVAIFVMSRQNRHGRYLMLEAERQDRLRRADAVRILMREARKQMTNCAKVLGRPAADTNARKIHAEMVRRVLAEVRNYLDAIPAYELGSVEMVRGLRKMIDCATLLEYALHKLDAAGYPPAANDVDLTLKRIWEASHIFRNGHKAVRQPIHQFN